MDWAEELSDYEVRPFFFTIGGGNHIIYKSHSANAFFYAGKVLAFFGRLLSIKLRHQIQSKIAIDISEGFKVTFRMSARSTAIMCSKRRKPVGIACSCTKHLGGLIQPFYQQRIGFLLRPFNSSLLSIDADLQSIFFTGCNL